MSNRIKKIFEDNSKKLVTFVTGGDPDYTTSKEILDKIPMKKFGESNDIAEFVYFLSSDKAAYITGQNFHINGGMLML